MDFFVIFQLSITVSANGWVRALSWLVNDVVQEEGSEGNDGAVTKPSVLLRKRTKDSLSLITHGRTASGHKYIGPK